MEFFNIEMGSELMAKRSVMDFPKHLRTVKIMGYFYKNYRHYDELGKVPCEVQNKPNPFKK